MSYLFRIMTPFLLISMISSGLMGQSSKGADQIIGVWYTKNEDAKVKIYKCDGDKYCGKIIWTQNVENDKPLKKDKNNPDPDKRDRTIKGIDIIKGLEYKKSEEAWEEGTIYDPNKGKDYNCYAELVNHNKLKLRGYIGVSMFGRSQHWKRIKNHPKAD